MSAHVFKTTATDSEDRGSRNEKRIFVLIHGGWCGGWLWRDVAPALQKRGHVVTTPTLTGLSERRDAENDTASLSTHIEDIVALIEERASRM